MAGQAKQSYLYYSRRGYVFLLTHVDWAGGEVTWCGNFTVIMYTVKSWWRILPLKVVEWSCTVRLDENWKVLDFTETYAVVAVNVHYWGNLRLYLAQLQESMVCRHSRHQRGSGIQTVRFNIIPDIPATTPARHALFYELRRPLATPW